MPPLSNDKTSSKSSSSNNTVEVSKTSSSSKKKHRALPPLFWYMETGDWEKATERAKCHPREVKMWTSIKTKSKDDDSVAKTKRLALHHACFKLRSVQMPQETDGNDDPFLTVCEFVLLLLDIYPEAAGMRESRHGCLALHLAAFASCAPKTEGPAPTTSTSSVQTLGLGSLPQTPSLPDSTSSRASSESSTHTNYSSVFAKPNLKPSLLISSRREELAVRVINKLLDAYPKAIRVDSEGGRLPLHTACAGRATPRVVSTLLTAYPPAARHRNKDGFLPLHLAAHWGVSHPNVAAALLKSYPDATVGRNRWERTPLEEALCMAGENGRAHQTALVRLLRKHPSYWTRPIEDIYRLTTVSSETKNTIVDMDETIDDETSANGDEKYYVRPSRMFGRPPHETNDLATLIRSENWPEVLMRIEMNPHECGETLTQTTRGGFVATAGMTPLHFACERRPPVEVVASLIDVWPEAVTTRLQPGGSLPLHVACTWHASPAVVSTLCQVEPATCRIPDELGNVPLHCAAFSGAIGPVVDTLMCVFPKAVLARNQQGSLPYDIVKRLGHENRNNILMILKMKKEEVLAAHHTNTMVSSSWNGVADQAMELIGDYLPNSSVPSGAPLGGGIGENHAVVSFGKGNDMIWI